MKKSSMTGWKDVFSFTLIQTLKSKTFIITNIVLLLLILVSMPLITKLTSSGGAMGLGGAVESDVASPIQKVYVNNKTSLPEIDFSKLLEQKMFQHITFETMKEDYDTVTKRMEASAESSVILTITDADGLYSLAFVKASTWQIKDSSLQTLGNAIVEQFEQFRINTLGITPDQVAMLQAPVETKVSMTDINGDVISKADTSISGSEYWFIYGILFIVLMVNTMSSSQIATSIVTEKSTRVIEYLLTSIKPLALMVGKVLAMLVAVLLQMVSMVVMVFISNSISASLSPGDGVSLLSQYLPKDIFQNLNIVNILFCFILVALGFVFYATLAGLAGATVSRMEDISEGITLYTFVNIIGAYIGIGAASALMGAGDSAFVTFSFLFPLSSPFILPGAILIGKASLPIIAIAIVLQILFIILLFKFVAKVYETLILHNGNTIKLKELIKISKTL